MPVSDISHLVRKRVSEPTYSHWAGLHACIMLLQVIPESVTENEETKAKRLCTEDNSDETGLTNAHVSCNTTSDAEQ